MSVSTVEATMSSRRANLGTDLDQVKESAIQAFNANTNLQSQPRKDSTTTTTDPKMSLLLSSTHNVASPSNNKCHGCS